jgi:hypothetical protein
MVTLSSLSMAEAKGLVRHLPASRRPRWTRQEHPPNQLTTSNLNVAAGRRAKIHRPPGETGWSAGRRKKLGGVPAAATLPNSRLAAGSRCREIVRGYSEACVWVHHQRLRVRAWAMVAYGCYCSVRLYVLKLSEAIAQINFTFGVYHSFMLTALLILLHAVDVKQAYSQCYLPF